nr:MAG TPA: hypothetical protein [Caudoviricetes sp.]
MLLIKKSDRLGFNLTYLIILTTCEIISFINTVKSAYIVLTSGGIESNAIHMNSFKISMSMALMFLILSVIMSTTLFSNEFRDRELNLYTIIIPGKVIEFELDQRLENSCIENSVLKIILRLNNVNK